MTARADGRSVWPGRPPARGRRSAAAARQSQLARPQRPRDIPVIDPLPALRGVAVRRAVACGDRCWSSRPRVPARRAELERARRRSRWCARAIERRLRRAGGLLARELPDPGPRIRLLPGAGGRGADRAAPAGQGRRAARGSVLAGPGPEQAGHPGLARRRLPADRHQLPPRPPRHRHQQLRRRHPDRRGRRGAGRAAPALAGRARRVRLRAGRLARDPHRRPARPWSARCRCGPARSPGRSSSARSTSTSPPAQLVRFRFSFTPAAYLDRAARGHQHRPRERAATSGATGCPTARRWRSGGAPPGSTFPARGIIRGRWEIDGYDLNVPLPDGALRAARRSAGSRTRGRPTRPGTAPLGQAIAGRGGAGQPAGHGRAPGGGRADRRRPGAERPALPAARGRHRERPRPRQPGAGAHARASAACSGSGRSRIQLRPSRRLRHLGRPGHRRRSRWPRGSAPPRSPWAPPAGSATSATCR